MHDNDTERMKNFPDISDDDVATVKVATLIMLDDRDVPTVEHAAELVRLLPNGHLIVLPGGHGDYLGELIVARQQSRYPELTSGLIEQFLDDTR
jgi:hypothetical protein